jgi:hypothetical protein
MRLNSVWEWSNPCDFPVFSGRLAAGDDGGFNGEQAEIKKEKIPARMAKDGGLQVIFFMFALQFAHE